MQIRATPRAALLALGSCLLFACQPAQPEYVGRPVDPLSFGETVYVVSHSALERADECAPELVSALESERGRFVGALDDTVTREVIRALPGLTRGAVLPAVQQGSLPELTDSIASALSLLTDDGYDPERETLRAVETLANSESRNALEPDHVFRLLAGLLDDPRGAERFHALSLLALDRLPLDPANVASGSDPRTLDAALELIKYTLEEDPAPGPSCSNALDEDGDDETAQGSLWLRTEGFTRPVEVQSPSWVVQLDADGVPLTPGIKSAEELPDPFGYEGVRDRFGRAIDAQSQLLHSYFDSRQTPLATALAGVEKSLEANLHHAGMDLIGEVLGAARLCPGGALDCRAYPADDHPVADLTHMVLESGKYERIGALMGGVARMLRNEPEVAEDLIVLLGELGVSLRDAQVPISGPEAVRVGIDLIPLISSIFEIDTGEDISTPRLLLDVVNDLQEESRDFPQQIALTLDNVSTDKSNTCSDEPPDPTATVPVDYSRPRYYDEAGERIDNRSSFEQGIELMANADCGNLGGQTLAHTLLNIFADQDSGTVCGLIDLTLGIVGTGPLRRALVIGALDGLGCDGEAVYEDLEALEDLAETGALDFYIPLATVFKERDQFDALLEIYQFIAADLKRDEDADPMSRSAMRRMLPAAQAIVHAGGLNTLFDLIDATVKAPASQDEPPLADLFVDSLARMIVKNERVETRLQPVSDTPLAVELLLPFEEILRRMESDEAIANLDLVQDFLIDGLAETRTVNGLTRHANPNLRPFLEVLLESGESTASDNLVQQSCRISNTQDSVERFLTGEHFATLVRLVQHLQGSEAGRELDGAVLRSLQTQPADGSREVVGPLLQVISESMQSDLQVDGSDPLLDYLTTLLDPAGGEQAQLVTTFDDLLQRDQDRALLKILRNLVDPGLEQIQKPPAMRLSESLDKVGAITADNQCIASEQLPWSAPELELQVDSLVDFMTDDDEGLGAVYELLELLPIEDNQG